MHRVVCSFRCESYIVGGDVSSGRQFGFGVGLGEGVRPCRTATADFDEVDGCEDLVYSPDYDRLLDKNELAGIRFAEV